MSTKVTFACLLLFFSRHASSGPACVCEISSEYLYCVKSKGPDREANTAVGDDRLLTNKPLAWNSCSNKRINVSTLCTSSKKLWILTSSLRCEDGWNFKGQQVKPTVACMVETLCLPEALNPKNQPWLHCSFLLNLHLRHPLQRATASLPPRDVPKVTSWSGRCSRSLWHPRVTAEEPERPRGCAALAGSKRQQHLFTRALPNQVSVLLPHIPACYVLMSWVPAHVLEPGEVADS